MSDDLSYQTGNEIRCGLRDLIFVITVDVRDSGVFAGVALDQVVNYKRPLIM